MSEFQHIQALLRIAAAIEKVAQDRLRLESDRDRYYKYWQSARDRNALLLHRIAALKGVITKLRKERSHP